MSKTNEVEDSSGKFISGSIPNHLLVMSGSATVGLVIIFLSDLVDMYFLGLLGEVEVAAAIGYAGSILFFTFSISIGLSIACGAMVSQRIGQGNTQLTKETITHTFISTLLITIPFTLILSAFIPEFLRSIGATGHAMELANDYIFIVIYSLPLLGLVMATGGILRAQGDAKGAMFITVIGGIVNVVLDPIFIFGLGLEIKGAAIATFLSRIAMIMYAYYILVYKTNWLGAFNLKFYRQQFTHYIKIAFPAVLTQLTTPISIAFITYMMAQFGDSAVAGNAVIVRLQPLVFAGVIALSGVVGPIAGQNFGARKLDRVLSTLNESIKMLFIYSLIVCFLLWTIQSWLVPLFNVSDDANKLIYLFCNGVSLMFIFNGMTIVTNSIFNNLGVAHYATIINVLKVLLGTIPFVYLGAKLGGPEGVLWGVFIGNALTGILGLLFITYHLKKLQLKSN